MSTSTDMLASYLAAESAILRGQSYRWGDRQLTRADLKMVQDGRREWERKVNAEASGQPVGTLLATFTCTPFGVEGVDYGDPCFRRSCW